MLHQVWLVEYITIHILAVDAASSLACRILHIHQLYMLHQVWPVEYNYYNTYTQLYMLHHVWPVEYITYIPAVHAASS